MSNLWNNLASQKPRRINVDILGETYEVRGMLRSLKNQIVADCTEKGELDNDLLECRVLAWCVVEPETDNPIQPDASKWDDLPAEIAGPLVGKCSALCGFDKGELVRAAAGKSEPTGSSG